MRIKPVLVAASLALACKSSKQLGGSPVHAPSARESVARPAFPAPRSDTLARVQKAVAEVIGVAPSAIPPAATLSKLPRPVDDLDVVEVVLALEETFQIEIPDGDLVRAAGGEPLSGLGETLTVEKLAALVEARAKARSEAQPTAK